MKQERKNILNKIKIQFVAYNSDFHLISRNNGNEWKTIMIILWLVSVCISM